MELFSILGFIPSSEVVELIDDMNNDLWRGTAASLSGTKYRDMEVVCLVAKDEGIIEVTVC